MKHVLRAGMMVAFFSLSESVTAQTEAECCLDCTCTTCAEIQSCPGTPQSCTSPIDQPIGADCGTDIGLACDTFYQNADLSEDPCIPIDGGLGFLIAGGLGIGVLGIRRRKEELELERG